MSIIDHKSYISSINAYIDPPYPVDKAIITHAHADHAKPNHNNVLATEDTINIMKIRYGNNCAKNFQKIDYGKRLYIDGVYVSFFPAGHILGSSQILIEKNGYKTLITGDYKTIIDPTAQAFELVRTHTLVTEATFGMPIFNHPHPINEIKKVISSIKLNNKTNHLIGAYSLGKAQRVIHLLRSLGYEDEIYIHGSVLKISNYYENRNIKLGKLIQVNLENARKLEGKVIIAPPSALRDKWSRKFMNLKLAYASGWMIIKQRAKQKLIELPLIISDHADWQELVKTIQNTNAEEILITHGQEDCLIHWCKKNNINAKALSSLDRGQN